MGSQTNQFSSLPVIQHCSEIVNCDTAKLGNCNTSQGFNPASPSVLHLDLNSCFASVEAQANPLLRGHPLAVSVSTRPHGCILASSYEAKLYGVKTGMSVEEGRRLCPFLVLREPDPDKYRQVHREIGQLLSEYAPHPLSKSIDEYCFVLPVGASHGSPAEIAKEIKSRIKSEIGDHLRVSVGISTNQNLAKLASGLHKPDGLDVIDKNNYQEVFSKITLQDFCGINVRNEARLHRVGIFTALQFSQASISTLTQAFQSVLGRYWYSRLRGYEVDDVEFARRSFGQSYVLPRPMEVSEWRPILAKLLAKAARRLRRAGYLSSGLYVSFRFSDGSHWRLGREGQESLESDADLLAAALALCRDMPARSVKNSPSLVLVLLATPGSSAVSAINCGSAPWHRPSTFLTTNGVNTPSPMAPC